LFKGSKESIVVYLVAVNSSLIRCSSYFRKPGYNVHCEHHGIINPFSPLIINTADCKTRKQPLQQPRGEKLEHNIMEK
jgi:hypothetical protein